MPRTKRGAELYKSKCQMCHAADGSGNTPAGKAMKARPFNSPDVLKESDADLTAVIKKGKNKMPAFEGKLTDAQITDLVAYIHTLQKYEEPLPTAQLRRTTPTKKPTQEWIDGTHIRKEQRTKSGIHQDGGHSYWPYLE